MVIRRFVCVDLRLFVLLIDFGFALFMFACLMLFVDGYCLVCLLGTLVMLARWFDLVYVGCFWFVLLICGLGVCWFC